MGGALFNTGEVFEMTPGQAIRKFCVRCVGTAFEVSNCGGDKMLHGGNKGQCWLYPYRKGTGRPSVKTIRKNCLECMGGSYQLVKDCPSWDCPVFPFRFGTNPNRGRRRGMF